jgi:replication factor C large subunit
MEDWTEKYRPYTLDEVVGNDKAVAYLKKWAHSWEKGKPLKKAVILSGNAGIGKTSAAIALARDYNWTLIELNSSDARNAERIKKVATSGAVNETFDDHGNFISSRKGGRKLILLDEADNLYERLKEANVNKESIDYSDKGGKKAIVETIKITNQPIILVVNDYYGLIRGSGEALKSSTRQVKFYNPYESHIFNLLRRICSQENITVDPKILKSIATRCKGDIRSAVNDLQTLCLNRTKINYEDLNVLGYRDRNKIIFDALRDVFKTKDIQNLKEKMYNLDEDPKSLILWINENIPKEYLDYNDLTEGYNKLSKADVFLGRTFRRQKYGLWSYACDLMNGGVSASKTRSYPNEKYNFPTWLRQRKTHRNNRMIKESLTKKISEKCHLSKNKTHTEILHFYKHLFQNNEKFAVKMTKKLDLSEPEIKYLLETKNNQKIKNIISLSERDKEQPSIEEPEKIDENNEEEDLENQQSLFDF